MSLNYVLQQLLERAQPLPSKLAYDRTAVADKNSKIMNMKTLDAIGDSTEKDSKNITKNMGKMLDANNKKTKDALGELANKLDTMEKEHSTLSKTDRAGIGTNKGDSRVNITSNLGENSPDTSLLDDQSLVNSNIRKGSVIKDKSKGPSGIATIGPAATGKNISAVDSINKVAADSMCDKLYKRREEKRSRPRKTKSDSADKRYLTKDIKRSLAKDKHAGILSLIKSK